MMRKMRLVLRAAFCLKATRWMNWNRMEKKMKTKEMMHRTPHEVIHTAIPDWKVKRIITDIINNMT